MTLGKRRFRMVAEVRFRNRPLPPFGLWVRRHGDRCLRVWALLIVSAVVSHATRLAGEQPPPGPDQTQGVSDIGRGGAIFAESCARCHGEAGEGVEDFYPDPLEGDDSVERLTEIIERTMPEEDPDLCIGQDARDVAEFVHQRFYVRRARERRASARVELARMTVPQIRHSLTDLVASFREPPRPREDVDGASDPPTTSTVAGQGLHATYFRSAKLGEKDQVLRRVDPRVDFDFGKDPPEPAEKFEDPEEFAARWEGGLFVEDTGRYEFRLRTANGVKLWLNDLDEPLVDGWVRSGDETEHDATMFLLGGRTYPIRIDFHKRNDARAAVHLHWQPPGGVPEPIPSDHLRLGEFPQVFVASTPFPPDDRSVGYERGTRVTPDWTQALTDAAIETANAVVEDLDRLADLGGVEDEGERRQRAMEFCRRWVRRAFRQPPDESSLARAVDRHFEGEWPLEQAVKRAIILTIQSPRFLYPALGTTGDHAIASRLSYTLCDGLPDQQLLDAASDGLLNDPDVLRAQAERLLGDPRARVKFRGFVNYWLLLDEPRDLSKDPEAYPDYTPELIVDLRRSLHRFVDTVVWDDDASDFRQLLRADALWVNERLAAFYGADTDDQDGEPETDRFRPLSVDGVQRAGVLTHPYLMAALAHRSESSPIHRGVFLARGILGRVLRSPPDAIELVDASFFPGMTTRQRVTEQTKPESCQNCHGLINPLGFALEHYDAVGRFREREETGAIDASGSYQPTSGEALSFDGARQLAESLAGHPETAKNFVVRLFEFLVKQPIAAFGVDLEEQLTEDFVRSGYHVRGLMTRIAVIASRGA